MTKTAVLLVWILSMPVAGFAEGGTTTRPRTIERLGTIECDMAECTPVVFGGRVKLVEYVRENYQHRLAGVSGKTYFRVVDLESGDVSLPFAVGFHLCCAMVEGDTLYVFGVSRWGAEAIQSIHSTDLVHWTSDVAITLPHWGVFNTSVCKADGRYVMAIEIDRPPEEAGVPFTIRFAESKDLVRWSLTPGDCVFAKDRYTACPTIRYLEDGQFYVVYLEQEPGPRYRTYVARSKNLVHWEVAKNSPILSPSDGDRKLAPRATFTDAEKHRIASAVDINNSDVDFCEFQGQVVITYSWGNQQGIEHLALASCAGSVSQFLREAFTSTPLPR
jgi:hypothetical protein